MHARRTGGTHAYILKEWDEHTLFHVRFYIEED